LNSFIKTQVLNWKCMYLHCITEGNSRLSSELCLCEDVSALMQPSKLLPPHLNKPQVYTTVCSFPPRDLSGKGTHLLSKRSCWAGYTPACQELLVGRVHTCLPRALGGKAQPACQGLPASCCIQTCLPSSLGKQVCTPAFHGLLVWNYSL
jgi:hypothetical protein